MKTIFFFCFVFVALFATNAQVTNTGFKHELGLSLMSYNKSPSISGHMTTPIGFHLLNGVMYNRYLGLNMIRAGGGFYQVKEEMSKGDGPFWNQGAYQINTWEARLGYARGFKFHQFMVYGGMDGMYRHNRETGYSESYGDMPPYYSEREIDYKNQYLGLAPFVGLKYNFCNRLSASVETNFEYLFRVSTADGTSEQTVSSWNPMKFLMVSYHFGKN